MTEKLKQGPTIETAQNWTAFSFIVLGIGLSMVNPWASYLVLVGLVASIFFIIKRTLSKSKGLSALTVISLLCWLYMLLSYALMIFSTDIFVTIYGAEIGGFVNWVMTQLLVGATGLIATVIELFRISGRK